MKCRYRYMLSSVVFVGEFVYGLDGDSNKIIIFASGRSWRDSCISKFVFAAEKPKDPSMLWSVASHSWIHIRSHDCKKYKKLQIICIFVRQPICTARATYDGWNIIFIIFDDFMHASQSSHATTPFAHSEQKVTVMVIVNSNHRYGGERAAWFYANEQIQNAGRRLRALNSCQSR